MAFKYSYAVLSTNFDLEPVLSDYLATYPNGKIESYQVVFKTENEHHEGTKSYIVVFTLKDRQEYAPDFGSFLEAYCKLHDKYAVAAAMNNVLPNKSLTTARPNPYHVYGQIK